MHTSHGSRVLDDEVTLPDIEAASYVNQGRAVSLEPERKKPETVTKSKPEKKKRRKKK